ncbi:hypothetical protein ACWIFI_04025 [Streptomyces albidoflavus]
MSAQQAAAIRTGGRVPGRAPQVPSPARTQRTRTRAAARVAVAVAPAHLVRVADGQHGGVQPGPGPLPGSPGRQRGGFELGQRKTQFTLKRAGQPATGRLGRRGEHRLGVVPRVPQDERDPVPQPPADHVEERGADPDQEEQQQRGHRPDEKQPRPEVPGPQRRQRPYALPPGSGPPAGGSQRPQRGPGHRHGHPGGRPGLPSRGPQRGRLLLRSRRDHPPVPGPAYDRARQQDAQRQKGQQPSGHEALVPPLDGRGEPVRPRKHVPGPLRRDDVRGDHEPRAERQGDQQHGEP